MRLPRNGFFRHFLYILFLFSSFSIENHNIYRYNVLITEKQRRQTMEHYNPLLPNKSSHKFITIVEIMNRNFDIKR